MARHFLGLAGAQTLGTPHFLLTQKAVDDLCEVPAIGLVYGDAGIGKTFAVESAIQRQATESCWFDFPGRTTTKAIAQALLEKLSGIPQIGTRAQLDERLVDVLSEHFRILVIDEAQRLYAEAIEYLRHLWDRPEASFSLLLVGGHGCWQVIERYPMVRSRLYRRVHFTSLSRREVLEHIPGFHPVYDGVDSQILEQIDDEFAGGNLRNWAKFTATAEALMRGKDVRLDAVLRAAFLQLGQTLDEAA